MTTQATTSILSNGRPDEKHTVNELMELLGEKQMQTDSRITHEGLGTFRFSGNFVRQSHVFNIRSNDPAIVSGLYTAMTANRQRDDYVADAAFKDDAASEYHAGLERTGSATAVAEARSEWKATRPSRPKEVHGEHVSLELRAVLEGSSPTLRRRAKP